MVNILSTRARCSYRHGWVCSLLTISLVSFRKSPQHTKEGSVHSFNQSIALWAVWRSPRMLTPTNSSNRLNWRFSNSPLDGPKLLLYAEWNVGRAQFSCLVPCSLRITSFPHLSYTDPTAWEWWWGLGNETSIGQVFDVALDFRVGWTWYWKNGIEIFSTLAGHPSG